MALDRIEDGNDEMERIELLQIALDGSRTGPIGLETKTRVAKWWPCIASNRQEVYREIAGWKTEDGVERSLWLGLHDENLENQRAASSALILSSAGAPRVAERLIALVNEATDPTLRGIGLEALTRGWPATVGLDDWLKQDCVSPSPILRALVTLARVGKGWSGASAFDALVDVLDQSNWLRGSVMQDAVNALVSGWAADQDLQDQCWASIGWRGPRESNMSYDAARTILLKSHQHDARVGSWVAEQFRADLPLVLDGVRDTAAVLLFHREAREAVDDWILAKGKGDYQAAQLAAIYKSAAAKKAMIHAVSSSKHDWWAVWSLLEGWGMKDPEVAAALMQVAQRPLPDLQYVAEELPAILQNDDDSYRLLMQMCELPSLERPDFIIRGFGALNRKRDCAEFVSAIMRHVPGAIMLDSGVAPLIQYCASDQRVRALALQRIKEPYPPIGTIARAYRQDGEIRHLILQRASPLPTSLRRVLAKRATQRFDDTVLGDVLEQCDVEVDACAKAQATIGRAQSMLARAPEVESYVEKLNSQLLAIGPEMEEQRVAAFGGLLALKRLEGFAATRERFGDKHLRIDLFSPHRNFSPVIELTADYWDVIEEVLDQSASIRLTRWGDSESAMWSQLAPYMEKSSRLSDRFPAYCEGAQLRAPALLALERLRPRSQLLLDCCLQVLRPTSRSTDSNPFEGTVAVTAASKCLLANFPNDPRTLDTLRYAATHSQAGTAYVALCQSWPRDALAIEYQQNIEEGDIPEGIVWSSLMWLAATSGSVAKFVELVTRFAKRSHFSIWDFAADTLAAIVHRLERDRAAVEALSHCAVTDADASIRISIPRLLMSVPGRFVDGDALRVRLLHEEQYASLPRFGLDITVNRIRRVRDALAGS